MAGRYEISDNGWALMEDIVSLVEMERFEGEVPEVTAFGGPSVVEI
ncbi:MAG: hypothetical protein HLX48_06215 [Halomonas sp.]|nr:hypothetical protein [Halomonas sp.]NWN82568.1 hypothetical protein [Halomonas sp.]